MFEPPGSPDILTLAIFAYQVYDTYKGAPKRFKDLASDVKGLEILLRILGNRLALQNRNAVVISDQDDYQPSLSSSDEAAGLEQLVRQAGIILKELQEKQGCTAAPRGLSRLRWSQGEVDAVRSRITSLCAIIAAFNSSIVLPTLMPKLPVVNEKQDILHEKGILSSIPVAEPDAPILTAEAVQKQQPLQKSLEHLADITASSAFKQSMATAGAGLSLKMHKEEIEVISAVYGPKIVTDIVSHIINAHSGLTMTKVVLSVTNETFDGDPWPDSMKAFTMVWRKVIRLEYGSLYSAPQKLFAEEGESLTIDLSLPLPYHNSSETRKPGSIYIVNASWHNLDVTDHVAAIAANDPRPEITASTHEFFARDPRFGHVKVMSVTWTYSDTAAALSHCEVRTVTENSSLQIPPFLDILCANWGGLDITNLVRARVTPQQVLWFDTNSNALIRITSHDPLPGWQKTISILYRYGLSEPMQLLVTGDNSGYASIQPEHGMKRKFFFSNSISVTAEISIISAVWGVQPVPENVALRDGVEAKKLACSNDFFMRDGWGGRLKTLQVFLRNELSGEIACVSAKEGEVLEIPTVWPEG
ncbi:hypothetical protein BJX99DRAFT_218206 [Aspergillus californicus]